MWCIQEPDLPSFPNTIPHLTVLEEMVGLRDGQGKYQMSLPGKSCDAIR
jgi:hypothetical protein